jgi:hypothetical protein
LNETLLGYRIHGNNLSLSNIKNIYLQALKARLRGIANYGYRPTIFNIITTIVQSAVVFTFPNRLLLKLYMYERGMKSVKKQRLESKSNYKVI